MHKASVLKTFMLSGVVMALGFGAANATVFEMRGDNYKHPLGEKQKKLKQKALTSMLNGKSAFAPTMRMGSKQFVEIEREKEKSIWTVLGEFSDVQHNMIPKPDRDVDNLTAWKKDFSRQHYLDLLFAEGEGANSMRKYYLEISSNRHAVNGDVTDWVQVPGTGASYDDGDRGLGWSSENQDAVYQFLADSVNGWYERQLDEGKTPAEINTYLSRFDVWDRHDHDGDGNFDEPDGYIDHFQSLHAGMGEETGGGLLGVQAIFTHHSYARSELIGSIGPEGNLGGGIQVGSSPFWIGEYTILPENGGIGLFAHEYAHDLGLPDLYDTTGNVRNSTGFWSLMASGNWLSNGKKDIGSRPGHMGAWEKLQLGWLNFEVAHAGETSTHRLGPAAKHYKGKLQGVVVVLPPKEVSTVIGDPYAGDYFYYSGSGNYLDHSMTRSVNLPADTILKAKVQFDIEYGWDYAYLVLSDNNGETWTHIATNFSTNEAPNSESLGHGITGSSEGWVDLTADLSAYSGEVLFGFRYVTDGAGSEKGLMVDEMNLAGELDGAETESNWDFDGFGVSSGTEVGHFDHYYLASYREYVGYDRMLEIGPYNFGFRDSPETQNLLEHYPYQNGLLINYWDTSQIDNNVSVHPGEGLILPIDAHPEVMYRADGQPWSNRIQSYDSCFSQSRTDRIKLHWMGERSRHRSQRGVPLFDDSIQYWNAAIPTAGVKNPNTGTTIEIIREKPRTLVIRVNPKH